MEDDVHAWLEAWATREGGVAASAHRRVGDELVLAAAWRLPDPVVEATRTIPRGKGMAGIAWADRVPVQTCNLKEDGTGRVKPGARAVDAGAAVALPLFGAGGEVVAVVGIAFQESGALSDERVRELAAGAHGWPDLS